MEIIDLTENYHHTFFHCLEDWSDEIKEAGNHKEIWFQKMRDKGFYAKLAVENGDAIGMIQYLPAEHTVIAGEDLYFINCIWVHGHKKGVGNRQGKGIGKALLKAAEEHIRSMGKKGVAAWGLALPFWMKASWFRKQGYRKCDRDGIMVLLWKPFTDDARPPKWIREKKRPQKAGDRVTVTAFINGWCPAQNMVYERAKRAAQELGDKVEFHSIDTSERNVFLEWGIADGLFIDGKRIGSGPPLAFAKIKKKMQKRVAKISAH